MRRRHNCRDGVAKGTLMNDGLVARRHDVAAGVRAMAPWLPGVAPFALVIGAAAAQADIPTLAGWLAGPLIFAGSAQVAIIEMLDAGTAAVAVIATALVINLRLILYSAAMATYWKGTPLWWRLLGAFVLVDQSFAVAVRRYRCEPERHRGHAYYLGAALALWGTWVAAISAGAIAGAQFPGWLHLEFLIPLYFIGEVVRTVDQPAVRRAVLTAVVVAALALAAPMHLGILIGIMAGITAGLAGPGFLARRSRPDRSVTATSTSATDAPATTAAAPLVPRSNREGNR